MKKILFYLTLVASLTVLCACGGTKYHEISDPEGAYFTVLEGDYTYTFSNKQVYDELREQVGLNLLIDLFDQDLLKATKKDNKSYWDLIEDDEIDEKIDEDVFLSGTDKLTEDEIKEARDEFYDKMFIQYGFNTVSEIRDYYRLNLSKKAYAYDKLVEKYDEEDFTDKQYQDYYNNNYKKGYYAIIVSYETIQLVKKALEVWDCEIKGGKWTTLSGVPLSEQEIVKTFINLYNSANSYKVKEYPESSLLLNEGEEYQINGDKIDFDLENLDELFYTHNEISSYDPLIQKELSENLKSYQEADNFYLSSSMSNSTGSLHYLVMKIAEEEVEPFAALKDEIREKLLQGNLSSTYISTEMAKLRADNNLIIYDDRLEEKYVEQIKAYDIEHPRTKKLNGDLVAKTDHNEYSADDLFKTMSEGYGLTLVASRIDYQRLLYNPLYNKIYLMDKSLKESERILDEAQYTAIKKEIEDEKAAFEAGEYTDYGYPPKSGWNNFIKIRYGVDTEEEVFNQYIYNRVQEAYSKEFGLITDSNSELASFYQEQMEKIVSEYFKVKGIQLVIRVVDEDRRPLNPEDWTSTQNAYAKLFYQEILEYLSAELEEDETYQDRFDELLRAYQKAPRFKAGIVQDASLQPLETKEYQFAGIEVSKYKTAGLTLQYSDLGTFTNNSKSEELELVIKEIWDNDSESTTPIVYGLDKIDEQPYLLTEEGYHIYVNLETLPLAEWEEGKVLPTIAQIMAYEKDLADSSLTTKIKSAITTYYKPIYNELVGGYNLSVNLYSQLKDLNISFGHKDFAVADFMRYLDLQIENNQANLKYID